MIISLLLEEWLIIFSIKGFLIGKSIKEDNCGPIIKDIFETSKNHSCSIIYPRGCFVGKNIEDKAEIKKELNNIKNDDLF